MAKFVVSFRRSNQPRVDVSARVATLSALQSLQPPRKSRARPKVEAEAESQAEAEQTPETRHRLQLDVDPLALEKVREALDQDALKDVIIEPVMPRYSLTLTPSSLEASLATAVHGTGFGATISLVALGDGKPLAEVVTQMTFVDPGGTATQNLLSTTDGDGNVRFAYDPSAWIPAGVTMTPRHSFWGWVVTGPKDGQKIEIPPLPKTGPLGWWHQLMGIKTYSQERGAGIKVGVIDSGVGPNAYLKHVTGIGSFIDGVHDPSPGATADVTEHGTHVSGIIGARPVDESLEFAGIAAGCDLFVARVFPKEGGASQGDIADAIDALVDKYEVDLINMSLGSPQASKVENDAINYAAERGTLCIAAAGNSFGQPILYPAAYNAVVAIAALGVNGAVPEGTIAAHLSYPPTASGSQVGNLYVANFSNAGPTMSGSAPGVGIISTVPARGNGGNPAPYLDLSGTSMASPAACAALATLLAEDRQYRALPRGLERAQRASWVLTSSWLSTGLSSRLAGAGLSQAWPT